jgi:hypothetical protein
VLIAIIFVLLAIFFALTPEVGPIWASLIIAGGLVILAIIAAVVAAMQMKAAKRRAAQLAAVVPAAAVAMPAVGLAARRAPAILALALLGAGFFVARR